MALPRIELNAANLATGINSLVMHNMSKSDLLLSENVHLRIKIS